ncbi:MAG: cell envelope integrity protein TolA [Cytophagales bacterium]|nr:cell envelope integrity protein TolA [Cytophagales bacterium]
MPQVIANHQFAPPPQRFGLGSMGLALLAHGLLIAALTWGTAWRSNNESVPASAELWAEVPVQAAPALTAPPPVPEPIKAVEPAPEKAPDIVTEKTKKQKKLERSKPPEPPKKDLKAEALKKKEAEAERQREMMRQDQMQRMAGLAGATGAPSSSGTAIQSAAPSSGYAGKVEAKIRPNITFPEIDTVQGNPAAEVDIRIAPDGTIVGAPKLAKSSGNKAWDAAVLRAIEKTDTLPRDVDGRVPSSMTLILRPKR